MKRVIRLVGPFLLLSAYLIVLNIPISTTSGSLPPLGKFLNPFSGFWQNAEGPSEFQDMDIEGLSLDKPASICFDERLVPHIFAQSDEDLLFIQGYLHAKYRLWQLDITARQSSGRLSEVFGISLLKNDQRMRRIGLVQTARAYAQHWQSCSDFALIEKYVAGVNSYIESLSPKNYPLEFKLFNYASEAWSVEKTALVVMSMNLMLCARNEDIEATNTLATIGSKTFQELFPAWNPRQSPVIPSTDQKLIGNLVVPNEIPEPPHTIDQSWINDAPRYVGSNNWAVNGKKTADGFPILCNDPHLGLSLPSIWYEMQLSSPNTHAYGVSLPGIPNLAIGFNEDIAWGVTNVGIDVSDLYEVKWANEEQTRYLLDGDTLVPELRVEEYKIKSAPPQKDTVRTTVWGPVFFEDGQSLALKWVANIATDNCIIGSFRNLSKSSDFEDYYQSLQGFLSPAQNFAFASQAGEIALKVQGAIPIKTAGEGQFIMNGESSDHNWKGFIPFDETPFIKNPDRNFVSSANQNSTDPTYPYKYRGYFDDYRGRTLNEALAKMENITIEEMKVLQNSTYDQSAAELCPILLRLVKDFPGSTLWKDRLQKWDHTYKAQASEPILFEIWKDQIIALIWDEIEVAEHSGLRVSYPELWRTIELLETDPENVLFDIKSTKKRETAHDLAIQSLESSMQQFDSLAEGNPDYSWSQYRPVQIRHLSRIPAFSRSDVRTGGTANALNATKPTHGPSWRMVVQLSDPVKAWGVYPGGQSGNPGSPYYQNMIDDWAKGNYYPLHFVKQMDDLDSALLFKIHIK